MHPTDPNTPFRLKALLTSSLFPLSHLFLLQEQLHGSLPLRQTAFRETRPGETSSPQPFERRGPGRQQEEQEGRALPGQAKRVHALETAGTRAAWRQCMEARPQTLAQASVMAAGPLPSVSGTPGGLSEPYATRSGPGRGRWAGSGTRSGPQPIRLAEPGAAGRAKRHLAQGERLESSEEELVRGAWPERACTGHRVP